VNKGGDADTTGAIVGMIAGGFYGCDDIPEIWLQAMNEEVMQQCMDQADALVGLSPLYLNV
jgi:ADP-ribosyl-[dinitrogen reductase] hydrolase